MNRTPMDDEAVDLVTARVAEFVADRTASESHVGFDASGVSRRLAWYRRKRRLQRWLAGGVAVSLALVFAGFRVVRLHGAAQPAELSYRIDDREPPSGGYVIVPEAGASLLTFSDGSKVKMSPQARGRVVELRPRGARFSLEAGRASVDIVPRRETHWTLEAGPFLVTVHGTSFDVAWNPIETAFELRLVTGSVSVTSPIASPEIRLRAGQTLRVSLRDRTSTIATGAIGEGESAAVEPKGPSSPGLARLHGANAPTRAQWSHRGWSAAVAERRAMAVLAEVERNGLPTVLAEADSDDLWALADAARYAGRFSIASQALTAQRKRFPASERARDAAFLLGRLQDRDAEGPANAIKWYDRYLVEAPTGAHVSDALGRKMTLLERWNRRRDAAAVAEEYLRRFPHGTYASAARALLRASTVEQ